MGNHLVGPMGGATLTLAELEVRLSESHAYLVQQAGLVVQRLADLGEPTWGQDCKREKVPLTAEPKPPWITTTSPSEAFAEVVNQCATLERLMDAVRWAQEHEDLKEYGVLRCHPTTSSGSKAGPDNDLVLVDEALACARFEVSDVASDKDGNGKELKDLISLGVLAKETGEGRYDVDWPEERLFLVVSSEFADRLRKPTRYGLRDGRYHYVEVKDGGTTRIFEVLQGESGAYGGAQ